MNVRRRRRIQRRKGFTLMEVLLVLAILVILGSMVTLYFSRIQGGANARAARAQISMIENAMRVYRLDVGSYPSSQDGISALYTVPSNISNPAKWNGPYLEKQLPADPWDQPYLYANEGADTVRIWSVGPDGQDGSADDITNYQ